jgi:hypothetical protein
MQDMGAHGIHMGGLTGLGGAALGMIAGQMADDGEDAFEKRLKVQVAVCPQCSDLSFKYHGGISVILLPAPPCHYQDGSATQCYSTTDQKKFE